MHWTHITHINCIQVKIILRTKTEILLPLYLQLHRSRHKPTLFHESVAFCTYFSNKRLSVSCFLNQWRSVQHFLNKRLSVSYFLNQWRFKRYFLNQWRSVHYLLNKGLSVYCVLNQWRFKRYCPNQWISIVPS